METFTTEIPEDEMEELARMANGGRISAIARDCLKFKSFIPLIDAIESIMIVEPWDKVERRSEKGDRRGNALVV